MHALEYVRPARNDGIALHLQGAIGQIEDDLSHLVYEVPLFSASFVGTPIYTSHTSSDNQLEASDDSTMPMMTSTIGDDVGVYLFLENQYFSATISSIDENQRFAVEYDYGDMEGILTLTYKRCDIRLSLPLSAL